MAEGTILKCDGQDYKVLRQGASDEEVVAHIKSRLQQGCSVVSTDVGLNPKTGATKAQPKQKGKAPVPAH